ncbi:hypothetical protein A2U01_0102960, partial [Trifolium medium]|nr:hypothetical protein [Trifolium medium]
VQESGVHSIKALASAQTVAKCLLQRLTKCRNMRRRYVIQRRFWQSVGITATMKLASVVLIVAAVINRRYL